MADYVQLALRICVIYLTLIIAAYLQSWRIWGIAISLNPVCDSIECKSLGTMYANNIDKNSKPCVDFYNYVCNRWINQYPRPKYTHVWNTLTLQHEKTVEMLRTLLEDKHVSDVIEFEEAKDLYKACMSTSYMEKVGPEIIMSTMIKVNSWPLIFGRSEQQIYLSPSLMDKEYMMATGESAFFDYNILRGDTIAREFATYLGQPISPYGMLYRYKPWTNSKELKHYKAFLSKIVKKIAPGNSKISEDILQTELDNVIQFREELRQIIDNTKSEKPIKLNIKSLQEWYNERSSLKETAHIDWLQVIRTIYQNVKGSNPINTTLWGTVFIKSNYFTQLANLLKNKHIRVIVNHIHLYFVEKHLVLNSAMNIDLKESVTDGIDPSGNIRYERERWQMCIEKHNMDITLTKMYVRAFFPIEKKAAVKQLFNVAKRLQILQILESNWLDSSTKASAIKKIRDLESTIGYPDWRNITKDETFTIHPLKAIALYAYGENRIRVTASFLQYPFYTPNVPYVINYGATVTSLGHELYHGFDTGGVLHDADRKHLPWTDKMYNVFFDRADCFENHYQKFISKELKKFDVNANASRPVTLSEDIADAMGLKLSYTGYRQRLKETNGVCPVLPGFEKFDCEKLFFIAFGNIHCGGSTTHFQEKSFMQDVHSAHRVRVNAAVANMKEFGAAFNCKSNDPLTAHETCDLWQN